MNPDKQSAIELLQDVENRMKHKSSKPFCDKFLQLKHNVRRQALCGKENDPDNFVINIDTFTQANVKRQIINSVLKPRSGFKIEWNLFHESGFEYNDMYE